MSVRSQASALVDCEVVDFGHGRLDDARPVVDLEPLELATALRPDVDDGSHPSPGFTLRGAGLALALTFILGLTAGAASSDGAGDASAPAPVALTAGPASVRGELLPMSASFAVAPVAVPIHNAGQDEVSVLSLTFVAWQPGDESSPRPAVTVSAGQTRAVATGVHIDCTQPRPPTPTMAEARVRSDVQGVITLTAPLSEPARALTTLWEQVCRP